MIKNKKEVQMNARKITITKEMAEEYGYYHFYDEIQDRGAEMDRSPNPLAGTGKKGKELRMLELAENQLNNYVALIRIIKADDFYSGISRQSAIEELKESIEIELPESHFPPICN